MRRKHDTVEETLRLNLYRIYRIKMQLPNNTSANRTYVDAVVVKVWVFVELVGGVVLVSGEELTQKMAEVVDGFCCHVERDTRRLVNTS